MLNISKSQNSPGAWINPNQNTSNSTSQTTTTTNINTTTKTRVSNNDYIAPVQRTSSVGQRIADDAKRYVGYNYVFGGSSPSYGFDCSGLVKYLYQKHAGINLYHGAQAQSYRGYNVSLSNLQPGDLLFYANNYGSIYHVAVYVGNGELVHASSPQIGVQRRYINNVWHARNISFAKRILN